MKTEEAKIVAALPDIFGRHDAVPDDLAGATVLRFGTIPGTRTEGGGLVIDYRPKDRKRAKRVVFGFNELGMWVESVKFATG